MNPSGHPALLSTVFSKPCGARASPLGGGGGRGAHGEVADGALLHVFLLPLGHVGLERQDALLLLPHEFHERRGVVLRQAGRLAIAVFLEKRKK